MAQIRYIVTTRKEVLESLKKEGYKIVGVDGTVPGAEHLYYELFDHHREGGADIQLAEMPSSSGAYIYPKDDGKKFAIVTTQVDADAIIAAHHIVNPSFYRSRCQSSSSDWHEDVKLLVAISYDCDHLCVPSNHPIYGTLSEFADDAAMVVAALKEEGNQVIQELGLPSNRRKWSIEDKELYSSLCFERGVQRIEDLISEEYPNSKFAKWNYREIARSYWEQVEANTKQIIEENRIEEYRECVIFHQAGMEGYIDPRCWIRATQQKGIKPQHPVTVTTREKWVENKFQGYSYTLGTIPLHPKQKDWDYTKGIFNALTEKERENNPNADGWGGRATVGGSGWNTPSALAPTEVIDIVLAQSC